MRTVHRTGGFEAVAGYARAVRSGDLIAVSGTAATGEDGQALFPGDVRAQTAEAFRRGLEAVGALGGTIYDVVRTRIYLTPDANWRASVEAHHELFADVTPEIILPSADPAPVLAAAEVLLGDAGEREKQRVAFADLRELMQVGAPGFLRQDAAERVLARVKK